MSEITTTNNAYSEYKSIKELAPQDRKLLLAAGKAMRLAYLIFMLGQPLNLKMAQ